MRRAEHGPAVLRQHGSGVCRSAGQAGAWRAGRCRRPRCSSSFGNFEMWKRRHHRHWVALIEAAGGLPGAGSLLCCRRCQSCCCPMRQSAAPPAAHTPPSALHATGRACLCLVLPSGTPAQLMSSSLRPAHPCGRRLLGRHPAAVAWTAQVISPTHPRAPVIPEEIYS